MGKRGPKPKPTAVKKARGTYRKDRAPKKEPKSDGAPACPAWITKDAKAEWKRLLPELQRMGVLGSIDRNALARYCVLLTRWKEAEQHLAKHGAIVELRTDDGKAIKYLQQSPYVSIARSLAEQLGKLEQSFGMNPSARSRIESQPDAPPDSADPLGSFLKLAK